jgi:hypothetical protein
MAPVLWIRDILVRPRILGRTVGSRFFLLILLDNNKDPDLDPYLVLMDPDLGGPKTYRSYDSGSSFGSATLHGTFGVSALIKPQGKLLVTYNCL